MKNLNLSQEKRKLRENLINVYLKGGCQEDGIRPFLVVSGDRMSDNGHRLNHKKLHLNMRKHFFTVSD